MFPDNRRKISPVKKYLMKRDLTLLNKIDLGCYFFLQNIFSSKIKFLLKVCF